MRIDDLTPGQRAIVSGIDEKGDEGRRLRELGFDEGVEVEFRHRGIFGSDPVAVRVGANLVAMRRALARLVEVE